jgi:hypothetical protein
MNEFMMIFRGDKDQEQPSPEQMQAVVKQWQDWIGGIAAQGKFVSTNVLGFQGKTLNASGVVGDGPYAEIKEMVGGYLICKAENLDEAVSFIEGCPTLSTGGTIEVRDIMPFEM